MAAVKAGRIVINLSAGTSQFIADMKGAEDTTRRFGNSSGESFRQLGTHAVTGSQAASGAIRVLEGNITNNIRAAERFIGTFKGLSSVLQTAFPVIGAVALGGVVFELIERANKAFEAFQKLQDAPSRITQEFLKLNSTIEISNSELQVTNDKLSNQIAKLQGKPQNGLALAFDEANLRAQKLDQTIMKTLEDASKLLKENSVGLFGKFLGKEDNAPVKQQNDALIKKLNTIDLIGNDAIHSATNEADKTTATNNLNKARKTAIDADIEVERKRLDGARKLQSIYDESTKRYPTVPGSAKVDDPTFIGSRKLPTANDLGNAAPFSSKAASLRFGGNSVSDQSSLISSSEGRLNALLALSNTVTISDTNAKLEGQKAGLEANKEPKSDPYESFKRSLAEAKAQLSGAKAELAGGDKDSPGYALAKGFAEASREIASLNEGLAKTHQRLNLGQVSDIIGLKDQTALVQLEEKLKSKHEEVEKSIQAETIALDISVNREIDKRNENLTLINRQIDAARRLADAESQGPDAANRAKLDISLEHIKDPAEQSAKRQLAEAEYRASIQKTVEQLGQEAASRQRLNAVVGQGIEGQRAAEIADIQASGKAREVIAARIAAQKSLYDLQDKIDLRNSPAVDGVKRYFDEFRQQTQYAAKDVHDILGGAVDGLNDSFAKLITGQKVNFENFFRGLAEKVGKFAVEQGEGKFAQIFFPKTKQAGGNNPLSNPSVEQGGFSGILNKLGLPGGGKKGDTPFGQLGSSEANPIWVRSSSLGSGSGGLGSLLPSLAPFGNPSLTKEDVSNLGDFNVSELGQLANGIGGGSGGGGNILTSLLHKGGGFLESLLGLIPGFSGMFAEGGQVDAGSAYVVGENGPELFKPPSGGTIVPNNQLANSGGGASYYIDARGGEAAQTEQRVKQALAAVHGSAVKTSTAVAAEMARRKPLGAR